QIGLTAFEAVMHECISKQSVTQPIDLERYVVGLTRSQHSYALVVSKLSHPARPHGPGLETARFDRGRGVASVYHQDHLTGVNVPQPFRQFIARDEVSERRG